MLSKKDVYIKAYKELEKRRLKRKILQEKNLKIAFSLSPKIEMLYKNISKTSAKLAISLYSKNKNKNYILDNIKKENIKTKKEIIDILIKNNLPKNFIDPKPVCNICNDYGIVENKHCLCIKKIVKSIISEQLSYSSNFSYASFSNFNLLYYSKCIEEGEKISAFDHMSLIFESCKEYAKNFPKNSAGLIMCGLTGLGKTHLSLAIAREVISKGFTAMYETAFQATRNILNNKYYDKDTKEENSYFFLINEADLFILDDLGGEFNSQFNKSAIFEIINIRSSLNRPIIINTNLTPKEIEKIYGERVASRIFSNLCVLSFKGTDNRTKVKYGM